MRGFLITLVGLCSLVGCTEPGTPNAGASSGSGSGGSGGLPSGPLAGTIYDRPFTFQTGTGRLTAGTLGVTLADQAITCTSNPTGDAYALAGIIIPPEALAVGAHALGLYAPHPQANGLVYTKSPMSQTSKMVYKGTLYITALDNEHIVGALSVSDPDISLSGTFDAVICSAP